MQQKILAINYNRKLPDIYFQPIIPLLSTCVVKYQKYYWYFIYASNNACIYIYMHIFCTNKGEVIPQIPEGWKICFLLVYYSDFLANESTSFSHHNNKRYNAFSFGRKAMSKQKVNVMFSLCFLLWMQIFGFLHNLGCIKLHSNE